jgi:hypothetical protein
MPRNPDVEAHLRALSLLVFCPERSAEAVHHVAGLDPAGRAEFLRLADAHHVVIRALQPFEREAAATGHSELTSFAEAALNQEQDRIAKALVGLERVCAELEAAGCPVAVMKTLDHWPDFGSDLDLFTSGDERCAVQVLRNELQGQCLPRTLGDRLAHKRSFALPGLHEHVELHIQRLGQAGEHTKLAARFIARRQLVDFNEYTFQVPAPEERVIAATLQRMYRDLYIRICDVRNTARLIEMRVLDLAELRAAAEEGGIWPGVATYLKIAADYAARHSGQPLELPREVITEACFGAEKIQPGAKFLNVPLLPQGASLYTKQLRQTIGRGDLPATARLSLLPPLATAAGLANAILGCSARIW